MVTNAMISTCNHPPNLAARTHSRAIRVHRTHQRPTNSGSLSRLSHIRPQMASQQDRSRVSGRKRKRDAPSQLVKKRKQSHHRDLKHRHKLTVGTDQDVSPKPTGITTVADTAGKSEASAERDDGITSTSNRLISRLEVVEASSNGWMVDFDFVYDHTKFILRQGKQYFSAKVEDRSFQPTDLNIASLDITPIPSEHFCPEIEHNITGVLNVRPNTYIKRPSLIYWGLSDTNLTWHGEIVQ